MQLAKGVRDIDPQEKILKNKLTNDLQEIFELYGFMPLETPILERYETLAAKGGAEEGSDCLKETFKLEDQGKRNLGLRFELTTSLARYIAMNPSLKLPFKRYEIGKVFRDGPIKLGRYRELWQCDVDIIGTSSMLADTEIILLTIEFFKRQNLNIFLKINNRKLLDGILEQAGIKELKEAIIAIDKLDKIGVEGVSKELEEKGYTTKQISQVFNIIKPNITIDELKKSITSEKGKQGLEELQEIFDNLKILNITSIIFDVSLARGQAYYTGTVLEAYLVNPKENEPKGSLAGGGRYDNMVGKFAGGGRDIAAVGISFGLEPIIDTLRTRQTTSNKTPTKVLILPIGTQQECLKITQKIRDKNIPAETSLIKKGVSKSLEYAAALAIPYVIIVGENELKEGKITLRNMQTGTEELITLVQAIKELNK